MGSLLSGATTSGTTTSTACTCVPAAPVSTGCSEVESDTLFFFFALSSPLQVYSARAPSATGANGQSAKPGAVERRPVATPQDSPRALESINGAKGNDPRRSALRPADRRRSSGRFPQASVLDLRLQL